MYKVCKISNLLLNTTVYITPPLQKMYTEGSHIVLLQIDTLCCQQKELEQRQVQDTCIIHTTVGQVLGQSSFIYC